MHYLERKHAHTTWPTALPSLSFTIIVSGLGKSIHRVIIFLGSFYSGNVVIGHSIYGVVVIDGSLHSQFYSMSQSTGIGWDVPPLNFTPRHMILGQVVLGLRTSCPQEQLVLGPRVPLQHLVLGPCVRSNISNLQHMNPHCTILCMRVLMKLFLNDASLVLRLHAQLPIIGKPTLVLSVQERSCPGRGHLVLEP